MVHSHSPQSRSLHTQAISQDHTTAHTHTYIIDITGKTGTNTNTHAHRAHRHNEHKNNHTHTQTQRARAQSHTHNTHIHTHTIPQKHTSSKKPRKTEECQRAKNKTTEKNCELTRAVKKSAFLSIWVFISSNEGNG